MANAAVEVCGESRTVPTRANGQPAVAYYGQSDDKGPGSAIRPRRSTFSPSMGARITEITAFVTPEIFPRFGLPSVLAP